LACANGDKRNHARNGESAEDWEKMIPLFVTEVLEPAIEIIKAGEEFINTLFAKTGSDVRMIQMPLGQLRDQLLPAMIAFGLHKEEEMILVGEARMVIADKEEMNALLSVYKHGDMKHYDHVEAIQAHYVYIPTKDIRIFTQIIDRSKDPVEFGELEEVEGSGAGVMEMLFRMYLDMTEEK
jgi:hypothetical protein